MRKICILVYIVFSPLVLYTQSLSIYTADSDTSFWLRYQSNIFRELRDIKPFDLNQKYHFRISYLGQVISNSIDVWSDDGLIYNAEVNVYTKEHVPYDEEPTNRYYSEKKTFDPTITKNVVDFISRSQFEKIPTDSLIKGWGQGFDGVEYMIETIRDGKISYKQYWTPSAQDSLDESLMLNSFIDKIWLLFKIKDLEKDFATRIPFECYNTGGPKLVCKILTKREKRKYKIERKNYRQQRV